MLPLPWAKAKSFSRPTTVIEKGEEWEVGGTGGRGKEKLGQLSKEV